MKDNKRCLLKNTFRLIITSRDNIVFPDIATSTGKVKLGVEGDGGVFNFELLPRVVFDEDFIVTEIPSSPILKIEVGEFFPVSQTSCREFTASCTDTYHFKNSTPAICPLMSVFRFSSPSKVWEAGSFAILPTS